MLLLPFSDPTFAINTTLAVQRAAATENLWEKHIWLFLADWFNPGIDGITIYTSGSTGAPRPIKHSRQAMLAHAAKTCRALQLAPGSHAWLCLPANRIGGMMMLVRAMQHRMDIYCTRPTARPFEQLSPELTIHFTAFTPMQMKSTEGNYEWYRRMETINHLLLGGEQVSAGLITHLRNSQNNIYSTFGMTETISHIALKKLTGPGPQTAYHTLPGIQISATPDSRLAINCPELGIEHLVTNDMVHIESPETFTWLGRADNVINSGGIKILPETMEQKLLNYLDVPFFVTWQPDEVLGQKVVLVLQETNITTHLYDQLAEGLETLSPYEKPKAIGLCEVFTYTDNGKIKRNETLAQTQKWVPGLIT